MTATTDDNIVIMRLWRGVTPGGFPTFVATESFANDFKSRKPHISDSLLKK